MSNDQAAVREGLLATILSEESYRPVEPESLADTGLPISLVEALLLKRLMMVGSSSGRKLAESVCLPFRILEPVYQNLRGRQIIVHQSSAPLNDYNYGLTEQGIERARIAMDACAYVGAAPVPMMDYVLATEAQSIRAEAPKREDLREAFEDITVDEELFESLGPAINSGAGLFLYGEPGNGKSTLAKRITMCFGQDIWMPRVLIEDGQLIKLFDAAFHEPSTQEDSTILKSAAFDRRWIKIQRPTVIVGGELTMEGLEIRYDPNSNVSEASIQMKSNCGCLLIDDFGRQRIDPVELLNRWIVPLESGYDFLTLSTGKKIQVPFEQLIIFSTNLDPADLVDEAFLRRIPYKIEIGDPNTDEFHELFEIYADIFDCEYRPDVIDVLIEKHYLGAGRNMRRCHPRDLLKQIRNFCVYNDLPMEMRDEYFDRVVKSYFSVVIEKVESVADPAPIPATGAVAAAASLPKAVQPPADKSPAPAAEPTATVCRTVPSDAFSTDVPAPAASSQAPPKAAPKPTAPKPAAAAPPQTAPRQSPPKAAPKQQQAAPKQQQAAPKQQQAAPQPTPVPQPQAEKAAPPIHTPSKPVQTNRPAPQNPPNPPQNQ